MTDSEAEVLFHQSGASGVITMNRPKALNALTLNMVRLILPQLQAWASDDTIEHVIIEGAGDKGFCAGGDIRALHDWGQAGAREATLFYREEYVLNRLIKTFPKPYIALMDGITMGGGVGMSVHGAYRVATQATVFAMPETGIGLLPDVGGTYFLPRLPGQLGAYMVLTGARLKAADTYYAGIATHYTPAEDLTALKQALSQGGKVAEILDGFHQAPGDSPLAHLQADIDRFFAADGVSDIIDALAADESDWAGQQMAMIETKSPTSSAVALRQMRDGAQADFDEAMRIEMRAVTRLMSLPDFYEGVRAIIIEKDNAPQWSPARHGDVTAAQIEGIFASLGDDELAF
jgi:enoyl-CoA hydratase